jgi:hypothetical protein
MHVIEHATPGAMLVVHAPSDPLSGATTVHGGAPLRTNTPTPPCEFLKLMCGVKLTLFSPHCREEHPARHARHEQSG